MKLLFKLFFILLLAGAGYTFFMSYSPVHKGTVAVVEEKRTGDVVSVITKEQPFIFYKALPWFYSVTTGILEFPITVNAHVDIPQLSELDYDSFSISIPIRADVKIIPEELKNPYMLKDSLAQLKDSVEKEITFAFASLLQSYLQPSYQYARIIADKEIILAAADSAIKKQFENDGIYISGLQYAGTLLLPDTRLYEEGISHLLSQRHIFLESRKKMLELSGQLEREVMAKEKLYKSYADISNIIRENPDILKYIYIDKMAGNLKVIVSSDKTALPAFLESDQEKKAGGNITETKDKNVEAVLQP